MNETPATESSAQVNWSVITQINVMDHAVQKVKLMAHAWVFAKIMKTVTETENKSRSDKRNETNCYLITCWYDSVYEINMISDTAYINTLVQIKPHFLLRNMHYKR